MSSAVDDLTLHEIRRAAERVLGRPITVTPESDIARDLDIDSLTLMNIVMELEDRFDISIPLERMVVVETVGDLAAMLRELRARGRD